MNTLRALLLALVLCTASAWQPQPATGVRSQPQLSRSAALRGFFGTVLVATQAAPPAFAAAAGRTVIDQTDLSMKMPSYADKNKGSFASTDDEKKAAAAAVPPKRMTDKEKVAALAAAKKAAAKK